MLNIVWCVMLLTAVISAVATGRTGELTAAMGEGAQAAVSLSVSTLGMLCAWTGLLETAEQAGLTARLSKFFLPVIRRLFPRCAARRSIREKIASNFSANLLGLGNAATPTGIAAVQEMARLHPGETPDAETMLFIVINTASLQLIPTGAVTLRSLYGSASPYDILPAVWLVSGVSLFVCSAACKWMERHCG